MTPSLPLLKLGRADMPVVRVPSWETPHVVQSIVGRSSPVSADLDEFRGIPYAEVAARWTQAQIRPRLPRDVFDATRNGPKCPQPTAPNDSRTYQAYLPFPDDPESEFDCLNLFVVRPSPAALACRGLLPQADAPVRLPVLVWIHGGGLAFGAATDPIWDPARLVLHALDNGTPIVAVCVNYRLNIFGFGASADILAAQDPADTGGLNFGLRDQALALAWVARHIDAFGGDPTRITLGGQSAGSISTHAHLLHALAPTTMQPLFRRVLLHSGALGTLGPIRLDRSEPAWQRLYDRAFGAGAFATASPAERVARLRLVPAAQLLDMVGTTHDRSFPVVLDNQTLMKDADGNSWPFDGASRLAVDLGPVDLRKTPRPSFTKQIDVLIGITDLECDIFLPARTVSWEHVTAIFDTACADANLRARLLQEYGLTPSTDKGALRHGLAALLTDIMFGVPANLARDTLRIENANTSVGAGATIGHVQSFHVHTGNPFPGPSAGVAHHCVELIYLFDAFHSELAAADKGKARGYVNPGDEPTVATTAATSLASPVDSAGTTAKRTNVELSRTIQDVWLDFIVRDGWTPDRVAMPGQKLPADPVLVFGTDRGSTVESMADDAAWQRRRGRWRLLADNPDAVVSIHQALRNMSLS